MFLQKWIPNLQDLHQSQSPETVPVCIVWQYYPHDNTFCIYMCDEYMKSIDSDVCHRPWSILWWIVRAYLLTIEHQVVQFVPSISISELFESILLTILLQISILPLWNDGHHFMVLILCGVVESSCLPTHNIVPHISCHDLPYRRTTKKYEDFLSMVIFQLLLRKFWIQTWFCNCQQYLCLFHTVFECTSFIHDQGKMLVLPNQLLYWVLSTWINVLFLSSQFLCHPHTQLRITLFHGVRISIPNWKPSPNRTSIGFAQIAFPQ